MSTPPVYYALAQARFSAVMAMADYVDRIQDRLRAWYPISESREVTHLVVKTKQDQSSFEKTTIWHMMRSDRKAGIILGSSAITFHTTHYETHQEFLHELLRGLFVVHDVVALDHVNRLGMRYLDAVIPKDGEPLRQYLADGIDAIPPPHFTERYHLNEAVYETVTDPLVATGTFVARTHRVFGPLGFPPDLPQNDLMLDGRFKSITACQHAVIDTDHYVEGQMPLDRQKLHQQLMSMHGGVKAFFQTRTTEHARHVWA